MELRERAGGDRDLFTAERKMEKQRRKIEQQREKQYIREKAREKSNVFNFINTTLGDKREFGRYLPTFYTRKKFISYRP